MAKQEQLDFAYMACAKAISELSIAVRKKVGCIIVSAKGNHIIAEGFNGTPSGFSNYCEDEQIDTHVLERDLKHQKFFCIKCQEHRDDIPGFNPDKKIYYHTILTLTTKPEVIHAEANAIAKVAKSTNSSDGATLYCTLMPCFECAKQIIQSGIKRVVYLEHYPYPGHSGIIRTPGLELLQKAQIQVDKLPSSGE